MGDDGNSGGSWLFVNLLGFRGGILPGAGVNSLCGPDFDTLGDDGREEMAEGWRCSGSRAILLSTLEL